MNEPQMYHKNRMIFFLSSFMLFFCGGDKFWWMLSWSVRFLVFHYWILVDFICMFFPSIELYNNEFEKFREKEVPDILYREFIVCSHPEFFVQNKSNEPSFKFHKQNIPKSMHFPHNKSQTMKQQTRMYFHDDS